MFLLQTVPIHITYTSSDFPSSFKKLPYALPSTVAHRVKDEDNASQLHNNSERDGAIIMCTDFFFWHPQNINIQMSRPIM